MAVKSKQPIIVVGNGVNAVSTIIALSNRYPHNEINLSDRYHHDDVIWVQHPDYWSSASWDESKIVRPDYTRGVHIKLADEAMKVWLDKDSLYHPFFHQVGFIRCQPDDFNEKSLAALKRAGIKTRSAWVSVRDVSPVFHGADFGGMDKVMFNPDAGFVDAKGCLEAVRQEAVDRGVKRVSGEVRTLTFDDAGNCTGVRLVSNGRTQELAGKVLLCTGARTAELLRESAPDRTELHTADRLKATGAMTFTVRLDGQLKRRFDAVTVAVFKNRVEGVMGELVSYKDGLLKFNRDGCWTLRENEPWRVSNSRELNNWNANPVEIPERIKLLARETIVGLCGQDLAECKIENYRFCWDAFTPDHDFIISKHPECQNLYLATGGTFHGWKFFPVIGDYIAKMLNDELEPEYQKIWAWNRDYNEHANTTYPILGALDEK